MHPALLATILIYTGMSALTIVAYAWDKRAARRSRRRIPEHSLHLLEMLGGWPGALLARGLFRHKTVKRSYRLVLAGIIFLHIVVWMGIAWLAWR